MRATSFGDSIGGGVITDMLRSLLRIFAFTTFLISTVVHAQNIGDIKGESQDKDHKDWVASNLDIGDSVINITNSGASGGDVCANLYTFSPDEQLISCCTCVVTPSALASLSVQKDLISNTLTPAVPTSVVIKLIGSTGGVCNAATVSMTNLANGLIAWGTTLHIFKMLDAATPKVTENAFWSSQLSASELTRITSLCGFIQTNGSGFGICKSCRLGGLGAVAQ